MQTGEPDLKRPVNKDSSPASDLPVHQAGYPMSAGLADTLSQKRSFEDH
jgi:hypothetical protein